MDRSPHILMCPPDHFGIEYEINPWMNRTRATERESAIRQWQQLRALIEEAGAVVSCVRPAPGLPDLVFTANAGLIYRDQAVLSRFRPRERQPEESLYRQWFSEQGYHVYDLKAQVSFEGAGDALFCGDTLFAGYRIRSDVQAHQELGELFGCRVVPTELVDPRYYHLDTCFCPLTPNSAIYYPEAFDKYGRLALDHWIEDLIAVDSSEAHRLACNAVVLGKTVITGTGCPLLHRQLRERGFTPRETPIDEFIKAGGSVKCLTLRLDGEDACGWKTQDQTLRALRH
ncbi:MAG: dimethylarginine dimethylaminohydrolase family protein [Pirellulaceae bacterium]